jgi:hypothetical protein
MEVSKMPIKESVVQSPAKRAYLLYFVYTSGWVTVPAVVGGAVTHTMSILADADFEANYMTLAMKQADVLVTNWGGDVQIDDSGRGRTLFNVPLCADAIAGRGGLPYPFNPARWFRRNSSIILTFTNNVATATYVQLAFHGNKMYFDKGEDMI